MKIYADYCTSLRITRVCTHFIKKFLYDVYFSLQVLTIRDDNKEGYIYVLRKQKK